MSETPYASIVGLIMYVMLYARLDVPYALGIASNFQVDPRGGSLESFEKYS